MAIATTIGKNVAEAIITEQRAKLLDEANAHRLAFKEYAELFRPLVESLQLMPYEVIVSVAIREADGEIRVVNV
jgi:hypothetical protein